jgi:quercetin dioxygenase-like cupin family protein
MKKHKGRRSFPFAQTVALLAGFAVSCSGAAEEPDAVKVETLLSTQSSWDGTQYSGYPSGQPLITVLKIEVPAHSALPWHKHPIPNAGYVQSGEIIVENAAGKKQSVHAGQVLPETVNSVHRGVTGDQPATLIVFYAGAAGITPSQKP